MHGSLHSFVAALLGLSGGSSGSTMRAHKSPRGDGQTGQEKTPKSVSVMRALPSSRVAFTSLGVVARAVRRTVLEPTTARLNIRVATKDYFDALIAPTLHGILPHEAPQVDLTLVPIVPSALQRF